jgi:hypothetical protein
MASPRSARTGCSARHPRYRRAAGVSVRRSRLPRRSAPQAGLPSHRRSDGTLLGSQGRPSHLAGAADRRYRFARERSQIRAATPSRPPQCPSFPSGRVRARLRRIDPPSPEPARTRSSDPRPAGCRFRIARAAAAATAWDSRLRPFHCRESRRHTGIAEA